jgi:ferrous iron transport protein B
MKIALAGNPNCGKSTLFNELTGLNQRTGNFPGVTVERHTGFMKGGKQSRKIELVDLPGAYSLFPKSLDEEVTRNVLCNPSDADYPDAVVVVIDGTSMRRGLYLATQILDLQLPVVLAINMMDMVKRRGISLDVQYLSSVLGVEVVTLNSRNGEGITELKTLLQNSAHSEGTSLWKQKIAGALQQETGNFQDFLIQSAGQSRLQTADAVERYREIDQWLKRGVKHTLSSEVKHPAEAIDRWLTHPVFGVLFFVLIQFLLFQSVFTFSEAPMEWIDGFFASLSENLRLHLPDGMLSRLLIDGIIAGIAGVLIFIPQIAFLFAFIAIMEDTGYMARVSFMMDKLLRGFGLNGRSVIPLMGGMACAVPSVMGARTISNWKERLITILVVPFMSCSARLPVYTLLISMVIPDKEWMGFNIRGFTLFALYMIGFIAALMAALALKFILKSREKSFYIMELPVYRFPKWKQVGMVIFDKLKVFTTDAGKVIISISVILWFMASFAPGNAMKEAEAEIEHLVASSQLSADQKELELSKRKLEVSYAGILGHAIEPAITPLGFDWKIGIALITSFAAREVFVGTMSTLYAAEDPDNVQSIKVRMMAARHADTGLPIYTLRSGLGLMLFYAFALQCMSTLAVVKRETGSWKWPLLQFFMMGAIAWLSAFAVYQL